MSAWQVVAQLLTAGGVGAAAAALAQSIPAMRKSGAERDGLHAGADKTRTDMQLELVAAGREQVAFLRAELTAMRVEFERSREEMSGALAAARLENDQLARELQQTRAEVSTLRGVVAALRGDLDDTRTSWEQR